MDMDTIKVIVVDDHELFRLGLRMAIESLYSDITIVGEAGSGAEFFALLKSVTADVILLDIVLPDTSGIEIARRLKKEYPDLKILAISAENTKSTVSEILDTGIDGFISKLNSNANTLVEAIHTVVQGLPYLGKDIADILYQIYVAKKKTTEAGAEFTEQERQIIRHSREGLSAKMIADRLCITTRTVDWHKSNIFRKLGINSTSEMIHFGVESGIIEV